MEVNEQKEKELSFKEKRNLLSLKEGLYKIPVVIFGIASSFLLALLKAYIILSIAGIFSLGFVTSFTLPQIFAVIVLINFTILKKEKFLKYKNVKKTITFKDELQDAIKVLVVYLFIWGIAFLTHGIIV